MGKIENHVKLPSNYFDNKTALITGSTSGIGKKVAKHVADHGGNVYVHGRNQERGENLEEEITNNYNVECEFLRADLTDMNEVRSISKRLENLDKLDYLVNNAGAYINSNGTALSNLQKTFVVNHLSHYLLTSEMMTLLRNAENPRVVNTASDAHRAIDSFTVPNDFQTEENGWEAYSRSKACNIMFTYSLREKFEEDIDATSVHPGVIPGSGFLRNLPGPLSKLGSLANKIPLPGVDSESRGAAMLLYGMTTESPDAYLSDFESVQPSEVAGDKKNRDDLWDFSSQELGIQDFN